MCTTRAVRLAALGLLLICWPIGAARGTVVFNDFGTGDAYDSTGQNVSLLVNVGAPFTPASAAMITDVTVAMKASAGTSITLSVCTETNQHPGMALASTVINVAGDGAPHVYHAVFASPASVAAGTAYWLKAVPGGGSSSGPATWMFNNTGQFGFAATLTTGAWVAGNGPGPVMRLEDLPAMGACCMGTTCVVSAQAACAGAATRFAGAGTACNAPGNESSPCCKADYNQNGAVEIQDIFDYLNAWFAGSAATDINGGGLSVNDIFDFLNAWFAGC
jgi:hypothetical protein